MSNFNFIQLTKIKKGLKRSLPNIAFFSHKKAQLSIYVLIIILAIILIFSIFLTKLDKLVEIKEKISMKYSTKENIKLKSILNSAKKATIQEINYGPFIHPNDTDIGGHYS